MISRINGQLIEKNNHSLLIDVHGIQYEVMVPQFVLQRLEGSLNDGQNISLVTYHYLQMDPSKAFPVLVGFFNEIERDFFEQFITVSGIGPRAAVRAIDKPISEIAHAIDNGDLDFLKTLPGIGTQRAKEIVAKLQGKVGRYGLIQDGAKGSKTSLAPTTTLEDEVLAVLLQLQYKRQEALEMIKKALERKKDIETTEDLLNEIYKQKSKAGR